MFDLESSITAWRRQMHAAGVTNPELLDELEAHLRDDIEQQAQAGIAAPQAFAEAARRMGAGPDIHREFQSMKLDELMKQKLRSALYIIAGLAIGTGLILPVVAKWSAHGRFPSSEAVLFAIGVAFVICSLIRTARGILNALRNRPGA